LQNKSGEWDWDFGKKDAENGILAEFGLGMVGLHTLLQDPRRTDCNLKDHFTHLDINECEPSGLSADHQHLATKCHGDANCTNTKGSYNCGCQEGYAGNGNQCDGNLRDFYFVACSVGL